MDQTNFDFNSDESNPLYLQLNKPCQQSLIDLMVEIINTVFYQQENKKYDQSQHSKQN